MHVGWVAVFSAPAEGRLPSFAELRDHIELRLARAPRYRQKLASVPLGLHAPEWTDDQRLLRRSPRLPGARAARGPGRGGDVDAAAPRPPAVGDVDLRGRGRRSSSRSSARPITAWSTASPPSSSRRCCSTPRPSPRCTSPTAGARRPSPAASGCWSRGARDLLSQQLDLLRWPLRAGEIAGPGGTAGRRRGAADDARAQPSAGRRSRERAQRPAVAAAPAGLGPAPARGSAHRQARLRHDRQRRDAGGGRRRHARLPDPPRRGAGGAQGDGPGQRAQLG